MLIAVLSKTACLYSLPCFPFFPRFLSPPSFLLDVGSHFVVFFFFIFFFFFFIFFFFFFIFSSCFFYAPSNKYFFFFCGEIMCFLLIFIFFPFCLYPTALRFDVNCKTWICVSCFETARRRFKIRSRNSILRVCPSVRPSVGHTWVEFLIKDISEVTLNEIVSGA